MLVDPTKRTDGRRTEGRGGFERRGSRREENRISNISSLSFSPFPLPLSLANAVPNFQYSIPPLPLPAVKFANCRLRAQWELKRTRLEFSLARSPPARVFPLSWASRACAIEGEVAHCLAHTRKCPKSKELSSAETGDFNESCSPRRNLVRNPISTVKIDGDSVLGRGRMSKDR